MPIVFAGAASHAPGMRAWPKAPPADQANRVNAAWDRLRTDLERAEPDTLVMLTSEHWTNFFLDHVGAFCIGLGETFRGPVEPWLGVKETEIHGDPGLAEELLESAYANDFELNFSHELKFDHGTMVPLSYLTPAMDRKVVPIFFNALARPRPRPARCVRLGRVLGDVFRRRPERIAVIATGGLSHDPGERNHGLIDTTFDNAFLSRLERGATEELLSYTDEQLFGAGAGAPELLAWLALAGVMDGRKASTLCYEPVTAWATGIGMIEYESAAA
jgi:aromatic ring-opening dioxygenase catalytic subunit (LigB family)